MTHHLLRITLPGDARYFSNDFREDLARTNALPAILFNYDEKTGKPLHQSDGRPLIPSIRTVGGNGWVGILADESELTLLHSAVVTAMQVTYDKVKQPCPIQIEKHQLVVASTHQLRPYFVREMVIKKGGRKDMPDDEIKALVHRRIMKAIEEQAAHYGLDLPPRNQIDLLVTETLRPRGMRLKTAQGMTNQYVMLLDVMFSTNLMLNGFWFAGNLTSRGHGRIGLKLDKHTQKQEAAK